MKRLLLIMAAVVLTMVGCKQGSQGSQSNEAELSLKVGIIQFADHIALDRARDGFLEELENEGVKVESKVINVQGDVTLVPQAANTLISEKVDVIYAIATPAAQGAMGQSGDIPIVFSAVTDPVSAGLVETNEKPGKNVTGVSDYFSFEEQLELFLKEFPEVKTIGVLFSTGEANSEAQIKEIKEVLASRNMELVEAGVSTTNDVAIAMNSLVGKIDAFVAIQDNLASSSANIISKILNENKVPSFAGEAGPVENGILMSDGLDYKELGKEAGEIAIEIAKGKSPGEIPVVFSTNTERIVNDETEKILGVEISR